MEDKKWYGFMSSNEWAVFMNIMKILTFILLVHIVFTLITEIDIVKELDKNHCAICMEKTGCNCYCLDLDSIYGVERNNGE